MKTECRKKRSCAVGHRNTAAGFVPIDSIAELCNIGTLWAFFMISLTVIVLRKSQPDLERSFKVPLVPIIPVISMALCAFLASQLDIVTWIVFII